MKQRGNHTSSVEFILLGITRDPKKKILYFVLFLILYMITLIVNMGMILVIRLSPRLHTPMYYFICNLSFIDFLMSSLIVPNTLWYFLADGTVIYLPGCAAQAYGIVFLGFSDCNLLAVMAFDRYTAICHPLHYMVIMSKKRCFYLTAMSYIFSLLYSMALTIPTVCLPFCGNNEINHFMCELPSLLKLSCLDAQPIYILMFTFGGIYSTIFLSTVITSYVYILSSILKFQSAGSRWKTFSTCGSHIVTVTLLFVSVSLRYFRPQSTHVQTYDGIMSVIYTVVVPMLNPMIYSVRNKDVKEAIKAMVNTKYF